MILKDTAPGGNPTPENQIDGLTNSYPYKYLNVSIEVAKKIIARELLSIPRRTKITALELADRVHLPVFTFTRSLHELAKHSLVTIKGSLVKANRHTESVLEGVEE